MFLGKKIIRDSKVIILKVKKKVFKIPLSVFACKEILREKNILSKVKDDEHFSVRLLKSDFLFGFILRNPYLRPAVKNSDDMELIRKYFKSSFANVYNWPPEALKKIVDYGYFLKLISENIPGDYNFWSQYLEKEKILQSSSHGDFHLDNILVEEEKIFFIDWIRYNRSSSRYFDLIDFYIFYNKKDYQPWMDFWLAEFNKDRKELFGIKIKREYFLAYAIWKVSEELKTLNLRNDLNKQKCKKYVNFLTKIREIFS